MSRTANLLTALLLNQVTTYFNWCSNETDFRQIFGNFRAGVRMFLNLFVLRREFDMVQVRVNSDI